MAAVAQQAPHSLADWHEQLKTLNLPADPRVKIAALQKLKASTGNADNVAAILQEDPALCLTLMHEANKTLNRTDNETKSLSHTVSLLGFPYVETLLRRAPDYDKNTFTELAAYQQQLSISLHAAYQVEAWAEHNPYWPKGELFWATVFQRSTYWALWYHAQEQMLQLQQLRAKNKGALNSTLEEHVFGCKLQELSRSLSRSWHLPLITQQSWQPAIRGTARQWISLSHMDPELSRIAMEENPELQRASGTVAFAIALANQFADNTEWSWYSRQTLRLQKILANAMHVNVNQAIQLSHHQAVEASRNYTIANTVKPAVQLMGQFDKALTIATSGRDDNSSVDISSYIKTRTKKEEQAKKPRKKPTALMANAPRELTTAISRLQHNAASFVDQHDVFEFAVNTLGETVNFKRATVILLNRQAKLIRSRYSFGCDNDPALRNFRHHLQKGDLFNKLLQKALSVHLNETNRAKIWPLLSAEFKEASQSDEFLMMSIFNGAKPVGVIYADNANLHSGGNHNNSRSKIDKQQYYFFKQLCGAVSQCLQNTADS